MAIPATILPDLAKHLDKWSEAGPNGRVFLGPRGATPKRSNFSQYWQKALVASGCCEVSMRRVMGIGVAEPGWRCIAFSGLLSPDG